MGLRALRGAGNPGHQCRGCHRAWRGLSALILNNMLIADQGSTTALGKAFSPQEIPVAMLDIEIDTAVTQLAQGLLYFFSHAKRIIITNPCLKQVTENVERCGSTGSLCKKDKNAGLPPGVRVPDEDLR